MAVRISTPIVKMLCERGLLPDHCRNVELSIPAAGPMVLTFEVFVTGQHLEILAAAFTAQAEIARKWERIPDAPVVECARDGE